MIKKITFISLLSFLIFLSLNADGILVFIFRKKDNEIQLLIQKRVPEKNHYGGLWSNTCCSHPNEKEPIIVTAKRRLKEEMDIDLNNLNYIGFFKYKIKLENGKIARGIDHVIIGKFDSDEINFNRNEVEKIMWISLSQLEKKLNRDPKIFAPWVKLAMAEISEEKIAHLF